MKQPPLAPADVRVAQAQYAATVAQFAPDQAETAMRLLARISTPSWRLEWGLPRWLGDAFGLPAKVISALVLSNVFGMAYARLCDDLADEDSAPTGEGDDAELSAGLQRAWRGQYERLFAPGERFWFYHAAYMDQWRRASEPSPLPLRQYTDADFLRLAHSAAPLKLCCAAVCQQAEREGLLGALTDAVDRLLVATVLLDHAQDWPEDLAAGRYNAFVACASDFPQTPECREANRQRVMAEVYLGQAGRAYFDLARGFVAGALAAAEPVACPALLNYLRWLGAAVGRSGGHLAAAARAQLRARRHTLYCSKDHSDERILSHGNRKTGRTFGGEGAAGCRVSQPASG